MEVGIVPSPDSPYLELGESGQGARRFAKHILTVGETFVHPATGKPLTVDESWWSDLKKNWDDQVIPICQFPAADEKNRHTENPLMNLGRVVGLRREGRKIMADIEVPDPDIASKIGTTILGASAMLHMDYRDSRSGQRRGKALIHVAATNHPHLVSLEPYSELVAACGQPWDVPDGGTWTPRPEPLMLCASDPDLLPPVLLAEPDYQPERDYGGAMSQEDQWRDDIGRLGLEAMRVSDQGTRRRGSKPEYAGIVTDRDRQAALSREREVTDEMILGFSRELADKYHVSHDAVHVMVHDAHQRSGLGHSETERAMVLAEVGLALADGKLEVDDEAILGLSSVTGFPAEEVLRLTAEPDLEDMFLAHPSKSGRKVTTKTRAHASDLDEDPADEDQPAKGGEVHAKVRELIERNPHLFTDGKGREGARSGSKSYGPTPYKSPGPSGKPQSSR